eukprot:CAMPEP_0181465718 /NCGR_PEP_ID=MMETSP1110-20121109/36093_1 /TAXON_ID=174948 /ORGANISM="Symbiodinium sp., Strain CCMP421" /LENGTH=42 /DNA_ID= /DNA_START= /DNA_END= /DNA_ORIENTATION=
MTCRAVLLLLLVPRAAIANATDDRAAPEKTGLKTKAATGYPN